MHRLYRQVVDASFLEVFKPRLDGTSSNLIVVVSPQLATMYHPAPPSLPTLNGMWGRIIRKEKDYG